MPAAAEPGAQGGWFAAPDPSGYRAFAGRYRARYGQDPVRPATLAYDAVSLVAALVKTQGAARFAERRCDGLNSNRASGERFSDQSEIAAVEGIKSSGIDFEPGQRRVGDFRVDSRMACNSSKVAHPLQQPAGDARESNSARASRSN